MQKILLTVQIFLLAMLTGCSAMKAYPGPELPDNQLSRVYFHSFNPIDLGAMTVDGIRQDTFAVGFKTLPGDHTYSVDYDFEDRECYSRPCIVVVKAGSCTGNFRTEAGKEYTIDVLGGGEAASTSVYTDGRYTLAGSGACN